MKQMIAYFQLVLLGVSLFVLIFAPFEIYKTINAHEWVPIKVKIVESRIKERANSYYPYVFETR